jgi:hypothetical protein
MVGVAGFEPATPASRTRCSTRLSHTPTWSAAYRGAPKGSQASKSGPQKRNDKRRCIRPTPALSPPPRRSLRGFAVPAGEWCNGNTAVFGTVVLGSSPSSPATSSFQIKIALWAHRHGSVLGRGGPGMVSRAIRVLTLPPRELAAGPVKQSQTIRGQVSTPRWASRNSASVAPTVKRRLQSRCRADFGSQTSVPCLINCGRDRLGQR